MPSEESDIPVRRTPSLLLREYLQPCFRNKKAIGIEYVQNPNVYSDASGDGIIATARHLVVLSAGAFGSPAILERSGVGSRDLHDKLNIQTVVDLPGVGESYQGEYKHLVDAYVY